jgi:hypothetical protein
MDIVMVAKTTTKPTLDQLIAHGWPIDQARKLFSDPEALVAELVQAGWPERDARIRIASPLFDFDIVYGDAEVEPPSLEELVARDRASAH